MSGSGLGDFLRRLVIHLERAGIPHMVTGSVASSVHGEPRSTQDVDLVVAPSRSGLRHFLRSLPDEEFYVSEDAAMEALGARRQFSVIDLFTGWKADLIVRKNRPFSLTEFERRQRASVLGTEVHIASAEDVVLAKLEWARESGGSERQLRDARGILATRADLDQSYLDGWATELGIEDLLASIRP